MKAFAAVAGAFMFTGKRKRTKRVNTGVRGGL